MADKRSSGFTIVELMIATVVFSVVLLVMAGAIIQIGRLYSKGITAARTQNTARATVDMITQSLQFNSGPVVGTNATPGLDYDSSTKAICVGSQYFMYRIGQQQTPTRSALVNSSTGPCSAKTAQAMTGTLTGYNELLGDKMRVTKLVVQPEPLTSTTTYRVTVQIAYGDYDLLCYRGTADCNSNTTVFASENDVIGKTDLACKNIRSGSQFCTVSELSTIVERRL